MLQHRGWRTKFMFFLLSPHHYVPFQLTPREHLPVSVNYMLCFDLLGQKLSRRICRQRVKYPLHTQFSP